MTWIIRTMILFLVVVNSGCAPKPLPIATPRPVPAMPGNADFQNAERAFEKGLYTEALDGYNTFLREAYDDPFADDALFKIGKIYRLAGRDEDAMDVFSRLNREFPESALVSGAVMEILNILFDGGNFESVITRGLAFIERTDPTLRRMPFFMIVAKAYEAMGSHLEAARSYYRAWNTASGADVEIAWTQLKKTAEQLSADDLQQLISQVTDRRLMGLLLYRLGMAFILDENYDEALDVFQAFVARFPEHPDYQDASDMIHSLTERARFTPFTVGCLLPLSGSYAIFGQRALNGIELALSQSGEMGGGIPFNIIVKDSRSDPGVAVKAVDQLDQQKVGVILGPMSTAEAAAESAQARGIPILVFTQRDGIPDIGTYVFRNFITPQMQVRSLVSFAMDELGAKRFAVLYPDENYGRRYMNLFWDQVIEYGGVVNAVEMYDPEGTDFAKPIKKLAGIFYDVPNDLAVTGLPRIQTSRLPLMEDSERSGRDVIADPVERISGIPLDRKAIEDLGRRNPDKDDQWHPLVDFDAVFIPDAPKKAGLIIPQLVYYDVRDVYLLGTNLWNSRTLLEMSGEYMKDTLIADGFFAESQSETVQKFVAAFQSAYGRVPGIIEAVAYDTAMMAFQTMRQTATDSRRDLKQALLQINDFKGVSGRTGFAQNGEVEKTLHMLRINRGRFVEATPTHDPEPANESQ
ncbi:penicillin-binding protein activator [uncultured Desulfosarcina sp.]|uniref:penicillin-binding protein activator n=1 Tax=uncultured Desulfosarcina sp. TaxID=218289 RepID=UPI0029C90930|nr:penicillin-binding protein activator [uncultured Desulfosarcina sp.]